MGILYPDLLIGLECAMTLTRCSLIVLVGVALPLLLATADASAARRHARSRVAQVTTATYATARPHALRPVQAGLLHGSGFIQTARPPRSWLAGRA